MWSTILTSSISQKAVTLHGVAAFCFSYHFVIAVWRAKEAESGA